MDELHQIRLIYFHSFEHTKNIYTYIAVVSIAILSYYQLASFHKALLTDSNSNLKLSCGDNNNDYDDIDIFLWIQKSLCNYPHYNIHIDFDDNWRCQCSIQ